MDGSLLLPVLRGRGVTPEPPIAVARTRAELRVQLDTLGTDGPIALVPTMGALHAGHLSLIERARGLCDTVIVSIFVNPTQFGPNEDFRRYPRDLERDLELCESYGVRLVFAPDTDVMYPGGDPVITVDPGPLGNRLCGEFRPGHFRGVLTVVAKLLSLTNPDWAVFGRKDFQQSVLIRRMAEDLDFGVRIEVAPTVREADGLALSSRNAYLSEDERADALGLWMALSAAGELYKAGETRAAALLERIREVVAEHHHLQLQYAELLHPETLAPAVTAEDGSVAAMAAFCGKTRLIDNIVLGQASPDPRVRPDPRGGWSS